MKPPKGFDTNQKDPQLQCDEPDLIVSTDILIVGSGYGAAMAALALAEKHPKNTIWVFERGGAYVPGDFPKNTGDLPGYLSAVAPNGQRIGQKQGLWDVRVGSGISSVVGSGLGGTSLINANVVLRPDELESWPKPNDDQDFEWHSTLQNSFERVENILDVQVHPEASEKAKYQALEKLADSLNFETKPAPLAVNFEGPKNGKDHENKAGINQRKCIDCGNCITGCNIGAKSTLNMNAWPMALEQGVKIYTGVTVKKLEHKHGKQCNEYPWRIKTASTGDPKQKLVVKAKIVILAAGTFGSTEILYRSRRTEEEEGLDLSKKLGYGFSGNGDTLLFDFGQKTAVHAVAKKPSLFTDEDDMSSKVGPTIVAYAKEKSNISRSLGKFGLLLEDGATPYGLSRIFSELITTQGYLRRFTDDKPPAWFESNKNHDPIATSVSLADHSQIILVMGKDRSYGNILPTGPDGYVVPIWPKRSDHEGAIDFFEQLDGRLKDVEPNKEQSKERSKDGFDEGNYLPNPLWKPLPDGFADIVTGAEDFGGHLVTVHPLGGCTMGSNAKKGVVNTEGNVFKGATGTETYEGLYVLDGSIIPKAIGANPLLTIAALSDYLANKIVLPDNSQGESSLQKDRSPITFSPAPPTGSGYPIANPEDDIVDSVFSERLFCP